MRFAIVCALAAVAAANLSYPLFKQCDPKWGNNEMGTTGNGERSTICGEGCAMSSTSMALNGLGVKINGSEINPGVLNQWLEDNQGYTCAAGDCNNLVLDAVNIVSGGRLIFVSEVEKQSIPVIRAGLSAGSYVYLAHVHHNGHFVLLTGWDDTLQQFTVNDPYFNSTTYPYDNITDIILYAIQPAEPLPPTAIVPYPYPVFKQCDPLWGNNTMETTTICAVGCLMSSTSMALAGKGIDIGTATANPGVLNTWLRNNNGYDSSNDMEEAVVPNINSKYISWPADGMHRKNDLPLSTIQGYLNASRPVIANVMKGAHFVLVVGWDEVQPDTLYVNDPGFSRISYSYSNDVVGWRLFDMTSPNSVAAPSSSPSLRGGVVASQ